VQDQTLCHTTILAANERKFAPLPFTPLHKATTRTEPLNMRLTHFFIDRPRFATVLSIFVTLFGLGALAITDWSRLIDSAAARPLSALASQYLCRDHRANVGEGCALAALGVDTAREGERVRRALTAGLEPLLALLSNVMPGRSRAQVAAEQS
jgi:hypothetical protein